MGKDQPIIFSVDMVKAILDGRKTMTRRVIKPQPVTSDGMIAKSVPIWLYPSEFVQYCPYGQVGDRLWVRETYYPCIDAEQEIRGDCVYKASEHAHLVAEGEWKPSIFMPRWASRITLEITAVRVERLQEIKQTDVDREGISSINIINAIPKFRELWDSINGKKYPWSSNPWVWVIKFDNMVKEG